MVRTWDTTTRPARATPRLVEESSTTPALLWDREEEELRLRTGTAGDWMAPGRLVTQATPGLRGEMVETDIKPGLEVAEDFQTRREAGAEVEREEVTGEDIVADLLGLDMDVEEVGTEDWEGEGE